jgi:hypothetical protein
MCLKMREGRRERGRKGGIPHSAAVTAKKMLIDAMDAPEENSRPLDQYSACRVQDAGVQRMFWPWGWGWGWGQGVGIFLGFGECFDLWELGWKGWVLASVAQ